MSIYWASPVRVVVALSLIFSSVSAKSEALSSFAPDGVPGDFASAPPDVLNKFHFVIPTQAQTHMPGRHGKFTVEFRNTPFSGMERLLREVDEEQGIPNFGEKPPTLWIYLPDERTLHEQKAWLASEARRQFHNMYPGAELRIKFRIAEGALQVTQVYKQMKTMLEEMSPAAAADPETAEYVRKISEITDDAYSETVSRFGITEPLARNVKLGFGGARFFLVLGTRSLQVGASLAMGDWISAGAGMALIVTDAALEFFTTYRQREIQAFLQRAPFRFGSEKLDQIGRFVNAALWNLLLFSVGRPMLMQSLGHFAMADIAAPTGRDALSVAEWSLGGAFIFTWFNTGYTMLRDKGWVSASQIDLALQFNGLLDLSVSLINSNPAWIWLRPFPLLAQWTMYAVVGALARVAPVRSNRILAVESTIMDWRAVHGEQPMTTATYHVENEEHYEQAMSRIRGKRPRAAAPPAPQPVREPACDASIFALAPLGAAASL